MAAVGLSIQIFQFLEKQPHMLSGSIVAEVSPEKCAAQVSQRERERERESGRRVSLVVWNAAVYVELRRLTNDAHQALNGHNKLLYLYPYLHLHRAASAASASLICINIGICNRSLIDSESRFEEYSKVNEN